MWKKKQRSEVEWNKLINDYKIKNNITDIKHLNKDNCPIHYDQVVNVFGVDYTDAKIYSTILDDYKACDQDIKKEMCKYFGADFNETVNSFKPQRRIGKFSKVFRNIKTNKNDLNWGCNE